MDVRVQAHVAYRLSYHIVWIPKYRRAFLVPGVASYLEKVLRSTTTDLYPDVHIEAQSIQRDHVHLLMVIPPKYAISTVVQRLKAESSRKLRTHFLYLQQHPALWSVGYFVSSVGIDEQKIRAYIRYQERHDTGQAKLALR